MTASTSEPTPCHLVFGFALQTNQDLGVILPVVSGPPDLRLQVRLAERFQPARAKLVYASEPEEGSDAGVTAYRGVGHSIVRFRSVSEFRISDDLVTCHLLSTDYEYLVPIQFLGIVMTLWMELRGLPVLHASGIAADNHGVAFLAVKRGGKTSLAAAMMQGGHRMLSDDLVALDVAAGSVLAHPGYPQSRMEPDVADHFVEGWEHLPIVHPDFEKRRVPVGLLGVHESRPMPLARIYLPERVDSGPIEITPIPGPSALVELLRGSFMPTMVARFGLESERLSKLASVTNTTPMKRLRYPSGLDRLPEVVAAVENDLGTLP